MRTRRSPAFLFAAPPRRSRWKGALAVGLAAAVVMAVGLVALPKDRAAATTAGTGVCAATVEGLTVTARSAPPMRCGILVTAGSGTFTVPAGVTQLLVEVLGGGGGGGNFGGGGGGEAVLLNGILGRNVPGFGGNPAPTVAVTPGESFNVSVGAGGSGGNHLPANAPTNGADSVFGSYVAKGGGAGGNYDPVTGLGTPGAAGGSGGGGGPTAVAETNPATIAGALGGTTQKSTGGLGFDGGSGKGTKSNFVPPSSTGAYKTYLAGGGGGGPAPSAGDLADGTPDAEVSGPYVGGAGGSGGKLYGGEGQNGIYLGVAEWTANRDIMTWTAAYPNWFGKGGGGGVANPTGSTATAQSGNSSGVSFNYGGAQLGTFSSAPGTPNANTGQGGGGGGSFDGLRKGSDGASGLVAIAWTPPGGGAGAPSAPTNVSGTPGTGAADVSWTAPDSDGGSAITGYNVESSTDGGTTWDPASMCTGVATTCTVTGLRNGTDYVFHVSATNANGTGPWSDPSSTVRPGVGPNFAG